MECKLCRKRTMNVVSLFSDDVVKLMEDLSFMKFAKTNKIHAACCTACVIQLRRACDLKVKVLKWHNTLMEALQEDPATDETIREVKVENCKDSDSESNSAVVSVKVEEVTIETTKIHLPDTKKVVSTPSKPETTKIVPKPNRSLNKVLLVKKKKSKALQCDQCEMSFEDSKEFRAHMMKHNLRTCPICSISIRSDNFKRHYEMHSASTEVCEICGKLAKNKESLRGHMFHQHKHTADTYKCDHCDRRFRYKYKYKLHIQKVHIGERNHQCELCGKKFFTLSDIRKHRDMTHLRRRPYVCQYCLKGFSSRYALKTHVRQHTQETPFKCEICAEGFRQKVSLKTHLKSKHNILIVNTGANKTVEMDSTADKTTDSLDTNVEVIIQEEC